MKMYKAKFIACAEAIVDEFLNIHRDWFTEKTNDYYGQRDKVYQYLMHWAKTGEFGPDYNERILIYCDNKFSEYLNSSYEEIP